MGEFCESTVPVLTRIAEENYTLKSPARNKPNELILTLPAF